MKNFDWSSFHLKILIKTSMNDVYRAWTLSSELEKWFVEKATFFGTDRQVMPPGDEAGDDGGSAGRAHAGVLSGGAQIRGAVCRGIRQSRGAPEVGPRGEQGARAGARITIEIGFGLTPTVRRRGCARGRRREPACGNRAPLPAVRGWGSFRRLPQVTRQLPRLRRGELPACVPDRCRTARGQLSLQLLGCFSFAARSAGPSPRAKRAAGVRGGTAAVVPTRPNPPE